MAWSAKVVDADTKTVHLLFTESVSGKTFANAYPVPLGASATWLADLVAQAINDLTAQQTAVGAIPAPGQTVTPTPPVVVGPDPNAAVKAAFAAEWLQLKQMQIAITHNIKAAADADFVTLLAKVKSDLAANQAVLLPLMREGT